MMEEWHERGVAAMTPEQGECSVFSRAAGHTVARVIDLVSQSFDDSMT